MLAVLLLAPLALAVAPPTASSPPTSSNKGPPPGLVTAPTLGKNPTTLLIKSTAPYVKNPSSPLVKNPASPLFKTPQLLPTPSKSAAPSPPPTEALIAPKYPFNRNKGAFDPASDINNGIAEKSGEFLKSIQSELKRDNDDYQEGRRSYGNERLASRWRLSSHQPGTMPPRDPDPPKRASQPVHSRGNPPSVIRGNPAAVSRNFLNGNPRSRFLGDFYNKMPVMRNEKSLIQPIMRSTQQAMRHNHLELSRKDDTLQPPPRSHAERHEDPPPPHEMSPRYGLPLYPKQGVGTLTTPGAYELKRKKKREKLKKLVNFVKNNKGFLRKVIAAERGGGRGRGRGAHTPRFRGESPPAARAARVDTPPPAAVLDLAHARGFKVEIMRLKGRVCQRHVLHVEGPKYNSQGRTYRPAWGAHAGAGGFPATRAPHLLLPACCNCCKKSALGCE